MFDNIGMIGIVILILITGGAIATQLYEKRSIKAALIAVVSTILLSILSTIIYNAIEPIFSGVESDSSSNSGIIAENGDEKANDVNLPEPSPTAENHAASSNENDITGKTSISGTIVNEGQINTYCFTTQTGGTYRFDVDLSAGVDVRVRISGENGSSINYGTNALTIDLEEGKTYDEMQQEKSAQIIRNLSVVRSGILRNYRTINKKMHAEYKSIISMPEFVPTDCIQKLEAEGIHFIKKSSAKLYHHVIELNRVICDRINNCKPLFPIWLNWKYVQDLFVMPDGLTETGTLNAVASFMRYLQDYPYQMYMNWIPCDAGNILYNDKKFATLLYQWHGDAFTEYSRVSDVSGYVKGSIHEYLSASMRTVIVVDCENSDPYKLCATLKGLDYKNIAKIAKIILFDDVHTASAWRILESFTDIPVEHILIERVKQNKSLVDIMLTARACQEHYQNHVDSFVIVSSDSDYWGLISSLSEARFLVMLEREKCSSAMKHALSESGTFYCYIDDFYSGNSDEIRMSALFKEMYQYLDNAIHLNVNDMFADALQATRISMTDAEKRQFYDRYIRSLRLTIDRDGNASIDFKH